MIHRHKNLLQEKKKALRASDAFILMYGIRDTSSHVMFHHIMAVCTALATCRS